MTLEVTLKEILSDLLDVPVETIDDDFGPESTQNWDSITHLKIVASIEEMLSIEISPEDQSDMLSFALIKGIVEHLQKASA